MSMTATAGRAGAPAHAGIPATKEFQRRSALSRALRLVLRATVPLRFPEERREVYLGQLDEASRNAEIAAEGLLRLLRRHPLAAVHVLLAVRDWLRKYYGAQRAARDRPRYLVYTQHDLRIPFLPSADTLYAYMLAQIAYVATGLAEVLERRELVRVTGAFVEINSEGAAVFGRWPTTVPRYLDHERLTLSVVQSVDEPLNCCPSLHIAYSILLYNIALFALEPRRGMADVFDSIRYSTVGMFDSVLYTKQHSIIDVAFGMLCARVVFERRFRRPFDDCLALLPAHSPGHPIPYDEIARTYEAALRHHGREGGLAPAVGAYLRELGIPAMPAGDALGLCYFDTEARKVTRLG